MHSLSLKFRITALALIVAVVPLLIFQITGVQRSAESLENMFKNDLEAQSSLIVQSINRYLEERVNDVLLISHADVLKGRNLRKIRDYLELIVKQSGAINSIDVVNRQGVIKVGANAQYEEGSNAWEVHLGIKDLYFKALDAKPGQVYVSEAHVLKSDAEVIFITPVAKHAEAKNHWVLLVEINISGLTQIVKDFNQRGIEGTHTYVVDKFANVIISTNPDISAFDSLPDIRVQPALLVADSNGGTVKYTSASGEEVMAGYADMVEFGLNRALDWNIISITPMEAITQPVQETSKTLLWVGIAVTTLTLLVAYYFASSITLPIQRTVALADEIRRGNYSHRIEENIGGEIGSLSRAINEMALRIEERTAEIVARNEKLTDEILERKLAQDRLKGLSHKIVRLQEEERRRVSRELHDGINQLLVSVKYKLESFERKFEKSSEEALRDLNRGIIVLDEAISEVRRVSHALRPSVLDDLGLAPAITNLSRQFSDRNQIDVQLKGIQEGEPDALARLPADVETAMYRITQEALMNIEKHAKATKVTLDVTHNDTNVTIRIEDDGEGFDLQQALRSTPSKAGIGLRNMRERIELLQGTFFIHSDLGKGTFLEVNAPLTLE